MDYLITVLIGFVLSRNIATLVSIAVSDVPFGIYEWILAALSVILVPGFIYFFKRMLRKSKEKQAEYEREEVEYRKARNKRMFEILDTDRENSDLDIPEPTEEDLRKYMDTPSLEEELFSGNEPENEMDVFTNTDN